MTNRTPERSRLDRIQREALRLPALRPASPPRYAWRLCKLCDLQDWERPGFADLCSDIMVMRPGHTHFHRKSWEFTQAVYALQQAGLWHARAAGLSVAAGHERLLYYASHHLGRIIATDIYGEGEFSEADRQFVRDPAAFAPYPYRPERLRVLYMNALDLKFPDDTFDFAFSLSSIEHFGGLAVAAQAVREMGRVVKPGGFVVVVTECVLNGRNTRGYFLPEEIERLVALSGLPLLEDIDWQLSDATLAHVCNMHTDDWTVLPHLNLFADDSLWTSICLVFAKPGVALPGDFSVLDRQVQQLEAAYYHAELKRTLRALENQLSITEYDFPSHWPVVGPAVRAFRQFWNRVATRVYVRHYQQQQAAVNQTVLEAFEALRHRVDDIEAQLERLAGRERDKTAP